MEVRPQFKAPNIAWPTVIFIIAMATGQILIFCYVQLGSLNGFLGSLLGIFLMNMSFTAWHESSHGNLSKNSWLNDGLGIFASFFSLYPGYFARMREHLAHHKWQGDPKLDPVYPRIQSTFILFPWQLFKSIFNPNKIPANFLPLKPYQIWIDRIFLNTVGILILALCALGMGKAVAFTMIVPRIFIFLFHAIYICYLPHGDFQKSNYVLYRINDRSLLWTFLTWNQSLHGIHHKWPFIPWYCYSQYKSLYLEHGKSTSN